MFLHEICDRHDFDYWIGCTILDRWKADWRLYWSGMKKAGWNLFKQAAVVVYWTAVRSCGAFCFHYADKERDENDLPERKTMENYFTDSELKCKCCGLLIVDQDFLDRLNHAREIAGFPFNVNSGYRCERHNRAVGSTSLNHVGGKAADIKCYDSCDRYHIVAAMIQAGILGIGIGKMFVHGDTNRTTPCVWTY